MLTPICNPFSPHSLIQLTTIMVLPIINFLLAGGVLYIAYLAGGLS